MRLHLFPLSLLLLLLPTPALAQSILPAADGTGTLVLPDGTTYTITGGTLSGDGANLFHSFEQFGLTATEVANFLADPAVQNILGRVVGGNASVIDGLLQVSGSPANLYLLNPAGILFGPNSVLNLEGSFTATTASGLGFGENWLNAIGENDYAALVGDPTAFYFGENSGALVNTGNLAVGTGERLTLAAGSVINLGTLSAPGGQIMVLAVPGENLIRLQPVGALLSLELATAPAEVRPGEPLPFSPLDLPSLLRGGTPDIATDVVVHENGTVSLVNASTSSPLPTSPGTALVSGLVDVAGETGGTVDILGERVALLGGQIDASGTQGGGTVRIGGDYQGGGSGPTSDRTYIDANSTITTSALERGDGGQVIVWADEGTRFDGTITAQGGLFSGNGGFVEVSGRETLSFNGQVDVSAPNGEVGTLLLDPTNITIGTGTSSPGVEDPAGLPDIFSGDLPGDIVINSTVLQSQVGNVVLQATNDITIAPGVSLTFVPGGSIIFTADADGDLTGAFTMDTTASITALSRSLTITGATVTLGNIDVSDSGNGPAGNVAITASSSNLRVGNIDTAAEIAFLNAGSVTLSALNGGITAGDIRALASIPGFFSGNGGTVALTARNDISTGEVFSASFGGDGRPITITSSQGSITTRGLSAIGINQGGGSSITLNANGSITTGDVNAQTAQFASSHPLRDGGTITFTTTTGAITTGNLATFAGGEGAVGRSGNINLTGGGAVTTGSLNASSNTQGGVIVLTSPVSITAQGNNDLTLTAAGPQLGSLTFNTPTLTFTGDEIDLLSPISGTSNLLIQPLTPTQDISVGGTAPGGAESLNLLAPELAALQNGFNSITIGRTNSTGSITLGSNVTFSDPLTLRSRSIDTTGGGLNGIDNASLTLRADAGITTGPLSTQGQPVSVEADFNGDSIGAATITQPITSNGGAITITGSTPAGIGVYVTNPGSLNSGGGEISITGNSFGPSTLLSRGIELDGTVNSQGGAITLTGTGVDEGITTFRSVSSGGGTITMNGRSSGTGTFARGVALVGPVNSTGGLISLSGTGANAGVSNFPGGTIDAGTGSVELLADNPLILAPVLGGDTLSIQNFDLRLPITLGGTDDPAIIFLNQDEIAQLGNGFTSRTIGRPDNIGAITLDSFTLNSPLTLSGGVLTGPSQNTTWQIDTDGSLVLGGFGAPLRLTNPTEIIGGDDATNTVLGSSGNDTFTLLGPSDGLLGSIRFRNISAFDGGAGLDTLAGTSADEFYTITGSTSGVAEEISFINVEAIAANGGQDLVDLVPGVPLSLDVTGGDGTLTLRSAGGLTLNANVTTPGNLALTAGSGDIVQSGGRVAAAGATVLGATGNISLGGSNDFSTVDVTSSESVFLNDTNNLQLNSLEVSSNLEAAAGGDLTATTNILVGGAPPLGPGLSADSLAGVRLNSGGNLTTADITAPGAAIALQAGATITSGNLDSSGVNGGVVSLQAGDRIRVNTINAQGTSQGGSITAITGRTFQGFGTFFDQGEVAASLSTLGLAQGGPITLAYGGFTFTVGNPSLNGTAGAITTGDVALLPGQDRPFAGSRIVGRGQFGEVQFISLGITPEVEEPPAENPGGSVEVILEANGNQGGADRGTPVSLVSAGELLQDDGFEEVEDTLASEFNEHFGGFTKPARSVTLTQARATLRTIQAQTGEVPAFVYVRFNRQITNQKASQGALELLLITAEGEPILERVLSADPQAVLNAQELLRRQLTNPNQTNNNAYLAPAQQLYGWIIAPIREQLEAAGVSNIGFIMDAGLRTLPLAALHSGEGFLIEDYSVGLIPSIGLIDPTYVDLNRQNTELLVAGASQFINQPPLLAARAEMEAIQSFWSGDKLSETDFTFRAVQRARRQAQIIHLATHAQFLRGTPDQSYIQFFDSRLRLNEVAELGWYDPPVDLVTLSACQTAMGNLEAELGFAGFALQAGARSALASLWRVNDEATAGLMTLFYQQLDQQTTKAEALRQTQLALAQGNAYIENGVVYWPGGSLTLPTELAISDRQELRHPFYWAAFTLVGSPW